MNEKRSLPFSLMALVFSFAIPGITLKATVAPSIYDHETVKEYVGSVLKSGGMVMIDCFEHDKMDEQLASDAEKRNKDIVSAFYQVQWIDGVCCVTPKAAEMETKSLATKIDSLKLQNASPSNIVQALARKAKANLYIWEEYSSDKVANIEIKDATVQAILIAIARSFGAKEIVLSPAVDSNGNRLPLGTCVSFGW